MQQGPVTLRSRATLAGGLAIALALQGCGDAPSVCGDLDCTGEEDDIDHVGYCAVDCVPDEIRLDPCVGGVSSEDVADTAKLMLAFEERSLSAALGVDELLGFLALAVVAYSTAFVAEDNGGFVWDVAGFYRKPIEDAPGLDVELRFFFGDDYVNHGLGDPVLHDLQRLDSYVVGGRVGVDASLRATLSFDGPGPLVELLGQGPDPSSPIDLGSGGLPTAELDKLGAELEVISEIADGEISLAYVSTMSFTSIAGFLDGDLPDVDPVDISGERPSLGQELAITEWTAAPFVREPNVLDLLLMGPAAYLGIEGRIDYSVSGEHFGHRMQLEWSGELSNHATLSCL